MTISKLKRSRRERSNEWSHHCGPNLRGRFRRVVCSFHPFRVVHCFFFSFFPRLAREFLVICHTYHRIYIYARGKSVPRDESAGRKRVSPTAARMNKNEFFELLIFVLSVFLATTAFLFSSDFFWPSLSFLSTFFTCLHFLFGTVSTFNQLVTFKIDYQLEIPITFDIRSPTEYR